MALSVTVLAKTSSTEPYTEHASSSPFMTPHSPQSIGFSFMGFTRLKWSICWRRSLMKAGNACAQMPSSVHLWRALG